MALHSVSDSLGRDLVGFQNVCLLYVFCCFIFFIFVFFVAWQINNPDSVTRLTIRLGHLAVKKNERCKCCWRTDAPELCQLMWHYVNETPMSSTFRGLPQDSLNSNNNKEGTIMLITFIQIWFFLGELVEWKKICETMAWFGMVDLWPGPQVEMAATRSCRLMTHRRGGNVFIQI